MGKGVHKSEYFLIYLEGFIKLKMFKCDMINQTYIRFVVFVVSPREKSITYIYSPNLSTRACEICQWRLTGNRFLHSKHQNQAVYDTRTGGAKTIVLDLHIE